MVQLEEITDALRGGNRFEAIELNTNFVRAVQSFTRWPVDAWAGVLNEKGRLRTLYWVKGNALGQLVAEGDNELTATANVWSISNVEHVRVAANVADDDFVEGRPLRTVTVEVSAGQSISLDVAECKGHLREHANEFVDKLLDAVSNSTVRA
ncbi:hypothetical protein BST11_26890 [Mycobacterium alsense]|uniref:SRPBCC family protein n=1 Tax=Mycobacterium alsense TaxID=324058 RepID=A0ABX3R138_9MYCO|nr:hypothetical protein [Mycobacterium alsense]OQZ87669.1 hypothetical protein BST11_26890 [Mycobacterium alsense]